MKINWDHILSYSTVKTIQIRDRRLGFLHLLLLITGVCLGCFYVFFVSKAYLRFDNAEGSVRFRLYAPVKPVNINNVNYCSNISECRILDSLDLVFPEKEESAAFIAFSMEEYDSEEPLDIKSLCDSNGECDLSRAWTRNVTKTYFPLAPENYQMDLSHQAFFPVFAEEEINNELDHRADTWNRDSSNLWGILIDPITKKTLYNSPISSVGVRDRFPLSLLLQAANMTADDVRKQGGLIRLAISYGDCAELAMPPGLVQNLDTTKRCDEARALSHGHGLNFYRYFPFQVPSPHTHVYRVVYSVDGESRRVVRMTGLRIVFWVTGRAGQFSMGNLLIAFASISTVIAVVTVFVDRVALHVMPQRELYEKAKIQHTKPFSQLRRSSLYEKLKTKKHTPSQSHSASSTVDVESMASGYVELKE